MLDSCTKHPHEMGVALCRRCHRAHHHGLLGITGNPLEPDGLVFTDRLGRVITGQPRAVPPTGPPPEPRQPYEHAAALADRPALIASCK